MCASIPRKVSNFFLRKLPGISTSARWTAGGGAEYLAPENWGPIGKRDPYWKPSFLGSIIYVSLGCTINYFMPCVFCWRFLFYQKLKGPLVLLDTLFIYFTTCWTSSPLSIFDMEIWKYDVIRIWRLRGPLKRKSLQVVPFWANKNRPFPPVGSPKKMVVPLTLIENGMDIHLICCWRTATFRFLFVRVRVLLYYTVCVLVSLNIEGRKPKYLGWDSHRLM